MAQEYDLAHGIQSEDRKTCSSCISTTERQEQMDDRKFEVRCDAGPNGQLHVRTHSLSVAVSQLIERDKSGEMWQSVLIICEESEDGCLTTKVIACHPEWDQNLQIACIRSRVSHQGHTTSPLDIDLKPVGV
jgi:hypothetical protein